MLTSRFALLGASPRISPNTAAGKRKPFLAQETEAGLEPGRQPTAADTAITSEPTATKLLHRPTAQPSAFAAGAPFDMASPACSALLGRPLMAGVAKRCAAMPPPADMDAKQRAHTQLIAPNSKNFWK